MDSGSEFVESDEDVKVEQKSDNERVDHYGEEMQGDDDEVDPRELMTSPPPESSSHPQRQHHRQNFLKPETARDVLISSPSRDVKFYEAENAPSTGVTTTTMNTSIHPQRPHPNSYYTRPNRFFGPGVTWKSWTRAERDLAVSLDRTRAGDLSLHLCGAFALRRELGRAGSGRRGRPVKGKTDRNGKGKARDFGVDGDDEGEQYQRRGRGVEVDNHDEEEKTLENQTTSYALPKTWTAWPMPVQQVPRDELLSRMGGDGESTYRARPDLRPSAALEECLIATATRLARKRWGRRDWVQGEDGDDMGQREADEGGGVLGQQQQGTGQETADIGRESNDEENNNHGGEDDNSAQEQEAYQDDQDFDYPMFTSQPYASPPPSSSPLLPRRSVSPSDTDASSRIKNEQDSAPSTSPSPSPSPSSSSSDENHRPVPLADEAQARDLFMPSARHILSQLDGLLLALHKSRAAYAGKPIGKPRGRSVSQSQSQSASRNVSRTRDLARGRRRVRSRLSSTRTRDTSTKNDDADIDGEDDDEEDSEYRDEQGSPNSPSRTQHHNSSGELDLSMPSTPPPNTLSQQASQKRKRNQGAENLKLQLRDWSDVVGIAALAGWDPAVVARASERCARLFGENMLFRTFGEGDVEEKSAVELGNKNAKRAWYIEQLALDEESSEDLAERDGEGGRATIRRLRISTRCEHCVTARSRCLPPVVDGDEGEAEGEAEWGGKSEESRKSPFSGSVSCRRCTEQHLECSGIVVQDLKDEGDSGDYPPQWHERACPYKNCARHEIPFRKTYHLQRHLDSAHHAAERKQVQSKNRSRTRSRARDMRFRRRLHDPDTDLDMVMDSDDEYPTTATSTHEHHITIPSQDTILCPVYECKRHRVPFSRGAKLYSHVKRMHPDVDVVALKRLETSRRGERRGRPKGGGTGTGSQSRSQSRKQSRSGIESGDMMRTTRSASRIGTGIKTAEVGMNSGDESGE
ncbi:hypothetical protein LTR84_004368 [Exophiala bonariae]|uniref:Rrn9 domain-containing protein n=1 Tax=Exophiala bonariae TaxID=1690606 RepID=A0AAV9N4R2_9EURO|nr:hypothetical protein LTR84_004368 [Exophiala bonariae]